MRRREFITFLGGAAAAWSPILHARTASARLGYLAFRSPISADNAFLQRLRELGWIEGQNITIDRRFAVGDLGRLKEFASELVRHDVDVILAAASAATRRRRTPAPQSLLFFRTQAIRSDKVSSKASRIQQEASLE